MCNFTNQTWANRSKSCVAGASVGAPVGVAPWPKQYRHAARASDEVQNVIDAIRGLIIQDSSINRGEPQCGWLAAATNYLSRLLSHEQSKCCIGWLRASALSQLLPTKLVEWKVVWLRTISTGADIRCYVQKHLTAPKWLTIIPSLVTSGDFRR